MKSPGYVNHPSCRAHETGFPFKAGYFRFVRHLATTDGYRLLQGGFGVNRRLAVTMKGQWQACNCTIVEVTLSGNLHRKCIAA